MAFSVDRPPLLAAQLATECVDLAWVDARVTTGLFHLLDSNPRQLSLFEPAIQDPTGDLPAVAIPILERFFRNLHRVLRASGHIFVLCEPTTNHRIRMLLDMVFGAETVHIPVLRKCASPADVIRRQRPCRQLEAVTLRRCGKSISSTRVGSLGRLASCRQTIARPRTTRRPQRPESHQLPSMPRDHLAQSKASSFKRSTK